MITVREAGRADVAALVELRAVMFTAMEMPDVDDPRWRSHARDWFEQHLGNGDVAAFVTESDGEVVAAAVGQVRRGAPSPTNHAGLTGLVSNVATAVQHRRQGHARACVGELLAWFREKTDVAQLELFATGQGAGMYEEFGFHEHAYPAMRMAVRR